MEGSLDLSSVVSMIMKHPEIIETIANLAKAEGESVSTERIAPIPDEQKEPDTPPESAPVSTIAHTALSQSKGENRKRLFSAIRPFLSEERAKTLSGVEAVVSILDSLHS